MGFRQKWEERYSIEHEIREDWKKGESWPRGDEDHYSLVIRLDKEAVETCLGEVRDFLSKYDSTRVFPKEYIHITIGEVSKSDVEHDALQELHRDIGAILEDFEGFKVVLKNVNFFSPVVFVEVHEFSSLSILRQELVEEEVVKPSEREFLPHVSLAQFISSEDIEVLKEETSCFRGKEFCVFEVNSVELVRDNPKDNPGFETVHRFELNS